MIAEGIRAFLNKKLITKSVSDNINKYYQALLDEAENYEDMENVYVDFDTYYNEALQKQLHMQDAYSFILPDATPQKTNKKSSIPAKFDIEKIKEMLKNKKYRESIMKTLPEHYLKNELTKMN